ncbi:MAG: hypothetical protein MJZ07_07270 [Bacteroidales bacterium]|nr:hypothetical protein [Bacteroidales bacterium]
MNEENKINPADLDGDGKVSIKEKIQFAANQAIEKAGELIAKAKSKKSEDTPDEQ